MFEQLKQYIKVLKQWQSHPNHKQITDTLKRINQITYHHQSEASLKPVKQCLTQFHKQVNKFGKDNSQNTVSNQWFPLILKGKKHIQGLIKIVTDPKYSQRPIDRKVTLQVPAIIQKEETNNLQYSIIFELLYKNFYVHMAQKYYEQEEYKKKVVWFLDQVIIQLFKQCKLQLGVFNKQQKNMNKLFQKLEYIVDQFKQKETKMPKQEMIQGEITPNQVAKCYPAIFDMEQARARRNKRLERRK